ncbi:MAG: HDOD domain-containing protein [Desulfobacterales bacterium]|jgi:diguanylate cyclase (GGDEF)-like protein|nr:HDOD domain-containing protein [Desulfobacterales bacterium]
MATHENLKHLSKKLGSLPTLPGVAIRILQATQREAPSISEISEIISADSPLSAKVLQAVNSPFYGLSRKITSVRQAIVFLGLNTVKNLALSFSLLKGLASKRMGGFDHAQFAKDALTGAIAAKLLAENVDRQLGENAFFLGLLQDIGILIAVHAMPETYAAVVQEAASDGSPLHEVETARLGINHMEVGAFATDSWGLPPAFSIPIGHHHCPRRLAGQPEDVVLSTRLLHLSSLYIDLFKCADPKTGHAEIETYTHAYGLASAIDPSAFAEQVVEGSRILFPVFDLHIDEKKHFEIIDAARRQLADLSNELLIQVHSQAKHLDQLRQQLGLDGMTQIYNHQRFHEILEKESGRASRYKTPLSIIMADVDHFKSINDSFGHQAGDHALKSVAAHLKRQLRDSDQIARYGGEEFAIIMPMVEAKEATLAAERLRKSVESLKISHDDRSFSITMSFGVATWENSRKSGIEGLIKKADEALYEAKNSGRNRVCLYKKQSSGQEQAFKVLVVDDEEVVLVTLTQMLERLGYAVRTARSGRDAVALLRQNQNRIDMVIMDMVLPDQNPDQLLGAIRNVHAGAKVVISSGYALSQESYADLLNRTDGFLQKPYQLEELARIVAAALNN